MHEDAFAQKDNFAQTHFCTDWKVFKDFLNFTITPNPYLSQ